MEKLVNQKLPTEHSSSDARRIYLDRWLLFLYTSGLGFLLVYGLLNPDFLLLLVLPLVFVTGDYLWFYDHPNTKQWIRVITTDLGLLINLLSFHIILILLIATLLIIQLFTSQIWFTSSNLWWTGSFIIAIHGGFFAYRLYSSKLKTDAKTDSKEKKT